MGIIYQSNEAKLEDMITYGSGRKCRKYFYGSEIKKVIMDCLQDEVFRWIGERELQAFKETYIDCKYPLADKTFYSLQWADDDRILKCYKKKDV